MRPEIEARRRLEPEVRPGIEARDAWEVRPGNEAKRLQTELSQQSVILETTRPGRQPQADFSFI